MRWVDRRLGSNDRDAGACGVSQAEKRDDQVKTLKLLLLGGTALGMLAASPAAAVTITYELTIFEGNESQTFEGEVRLQEEDGNGIVNGNIPAPLNAGTGDKPQTTLVGRVDEVFQFAGNTVTGLTFSNVLDPISTVALAVTDFGAPSIFALSVFGLAILPTITGPADLMSSIVATCTDADGAGGSAGGAGCTYSPIGGNPTVAAYDINGIFVPALDINPGETIDGVAGAGAVFSAMTTINCGLAPYAPACATMSHTIGFVGPGGGDTLTFNSRLEIFAVPAPLTIGLLGAGLFALGCATRRR
jgi:hypothetical protein